MDSSNRFNLEHTMSIGSTRASAVTGARRHGEDLARRRGHHAEPAAHPALPDVRAQGLLRRARSAEVHEPLHLPGREAERRGQGDLRLRLGAEPEGRAEEGQGPLGALLPSDVGDARARPRDDPAPDLAAVPQPGRPGAAQAPGGALAAA
eukprot:CAMPEP_0168714782 /NCGR_PEP_ID=MMETSP0503-20121227/44865_1 /TAXON_ID=89963 /ORGANISM="Heterocapsa rotundata, Strain SCCAP K-0483" /LENGTH=149 /DNA_ID=CAMNT_0008761225 /DNA_START=23 /DNA_END=469 /DNA_ORIENTATION=+